MQYSNYLAHMAALIKQNPSITVRQIAAELQFADSKSVYYWLEKGNIKGINEFKRLVLGEECPQPGLFSIEIEGTPHYLVSIPLFDWNPKRKKPVEEWFHLHNHPQPQGLFAIRVGTNDYSPWFMENDVLIIDGDRNSDSLWRLYRTEQRFLIGRSINGHVLEPNTLHHYPDSLTAVGAILTQHRHFS
ncbi:MAG TPA: hypothetical protein GX014_01100 [Firmicutes bacterium]|nr:hypothetical protein [Bacillota bacterium]HHT41987.1 hypothetical protein [Bacillota bacterium]